MQPKYKRVLIKLSGEALAGPAGHGLDENVISYVVNQIVEVHNMGVEIALVIGGGNFWRGRQGKNMDRTTADHMGMLATVMNSLAMMDALEQRGVPTRVQTALIMTSVAEPYILRKALSHFEKGRVVIMACGTGNPYCSTDTAAAQRACEIQADVLMLAKNIDAIYDSDPKLNPDAKKYDHIKERHQGDGHHRRNHVHGKQYPRDSLRAGRKKFNRPRRLRRKAGHFNRQ